MRRYVNVPADHGKTIPAAKYSANSLSKSAAYTITEADINLSGGHLIVNMTGSSAVDLTLPTAAIGKGAMVTLIKPAGDTDAYSFLATGGATINGGTADKRYQNVTNEVGTATIWSDGTNWHVFAKSGTWVNNNT